ncbi:LysR family transcriptional regulator [Brevibacillus fortis]|uniref:LysR family transcriptional regulator n=1 Tax=Brevibacillus fortis TaxID=2126352 RepID=A0A2P7VK04_9BACL|nr:LysR family transcriptional regulator [Brevibacillus fortis]PSJ99563.1 LysR family transcriptional regulator [Brevibacillus fortis]
MNIDQLVYVVEVAKTKSISIASENLLVTQSTISQAITRLEDELGMKLFIRSRLGAIPTQEASSILEKCQHILDTVQDIKEEATYQTEALRGHLRLSVLPGAMPLLVQAVSTMKAVYPDIEFELSEKASMDIVKDIRNRRTDLGLIAMYEDDERYKNNGLFFQPFSKGRLVLAMSKHSPLAAKKIVTIEELRDQSFVLLNDEFIDQFIDELTHMFGSTSILFRTNHTDAIRVALIRQMAISVGHDYSFSLNSYMRSPMNEIVTVELDMPQRPILFGFLRAEVNHVNRIAELFVNRFQYEMSKMPNVHS